jgi:hypothetical protein
MVFKIRKFCVNQYAAGFGVLAVLVPVIITVVLTGASYAVDNKTTTVGSLAIFVPENYQNMTMSERINYLNVQHGGEPELQAEKTWFLFGLDNPFRNDRIYPDGSVITQAQYDKYVEGQALNVDYWEVTMSCLTINPPILTTIGDWGIFIRVILIVSVAIGLVELLWIG